MPVLKPTTLGIATLLTMAVACAPVFAQKIPQQCGISDINVAESHLGVFDYIFTDPDEDDLRQRYGLPYLPTEEGAVIRKASTCTAVLSQVVQYLNSTVYQGSAYTVDDFTFSVLKFGNYYVVPIWFTQSTSSGQVSISSRHPVVILDAATTAVITSLM